MRGWATLLRVVGNDDLADLLHELVDPHHGEVARQLVADTQVGDTETIDAADLEVTVEGGHGVAVGTDGDGAGGVVAPGLVLDELVQVVALHVGTGPDLGEGTVEDLVQAGEEGAVAAGEETTDGDDVAHDATGVVVGLADSSQVESGLGVVVELAEVDDGHVTGVGGSQLDSTVVVALVGLEDDPGPVLRVGGAALRPARVVTGEVGGSSEHHDVGLTAGRGGGVADDSDGDTVGGVGAAAELVVALDKGLHAGVQLGVGVPGALLGQGKGSLGLGDHGLLVAVLEVGSDTGEVEDDVDAELLELLLGADTGQLENLGGVIGTAGDDDLLGDADVAGAGGLGATTAGVGAVESLALHVVDAGGAGLVAGGVKGDLGGQGVEHDVEVVLAATVVVGGHGGVDDQVVDTTAVRVLAHHQGHLVDLGHHGLAGGVDVANEDAGEVGGGVHDLVEDGLAKGGGGTGQDRDDLEIGGGRQERGDLQRVPARGAGVGGVGLVADVGDAGEVLAHVGRVVRVVARQLDHVLPVHLVGLHAEEGVVARATAKGTGTRVVDTQRLGALGDLVRGGGRAQVARGVVRGPLLAVGGVVHHLGVPLVQLRVVVLVDVVRPLHAPVLGRGNVHGRHLLDEVQARVATGLDDERLEAGDGQVRAHVTTTGSTSDTHKVVLGCAVADKVVVILGRPLGDEGVVSGHGQSRRHLRERSAHGELVRQLHCELSLSIILYPHKNKRMTVVGC